jgi:hypothetical protein
MLAFIIGRAELYLRALLFFSLIVVAVLLVSSAIFGVRVGPDQIGVRRIGFGPGQGYQEQPLEPGFHWALPFLNYSTVVTLPSASQVLHFNRDAVVDDSSANEENSPQSSAAVNAKTGKPLFALRSVGLGPFEVKTKDGAQVISDLSLFTRFYSKPGTIELGDGTKIDHAGPAELLRSLGTDPSRWVSRIQEAAGDAILRSLGSLSREQFYNPTERMKRIAEAEILMNRSLARFGIQVQAVLLRRYTYEADQIDEAIFLKNLQDQEEKLNATLVAVEQQKKRLTELAAEYDATIKTTLVTAESEASIIRSEGDLAYSQKVADGDLALASSQAEADRLKALALGSTAGGENYVARELAPIISALQGGIVSDLDPFDLDDWEQKLRGADSSSGGYSGGGVGR